VREWVIDVDTIQKNHVKMDISNSAYCRSAHVQAFRTSDMPSPHIARVAGIVG
jgi:hypothetical protein